MDKIYDFEDDSEDETVTRQGVRYNNVEQTKPDDENILPGGSADQGIIDYEGYDSDKDREYVPSTSDAESAETDEREDVYENYIDENAGQIDQIGDANTAEVDRNRSPKILKRKRQRNPASWKCNQRKAARAAGKEYVSIRNKVVPAKRLRIAKDCQNRCLYNCQKLITEDERTNIFERYYTLPEHGKKLFLLSTTKKCDVERHRKNKNDVNSRRKHTYNYYFRVGNTEIPVCKVFYLSTLNISQTPVYTAHSKKDISNIPDVPLQGKHTKYSVPLEDVNFVKTHIESFPKVNSHYCRANTQRLYLEPSLNIKKMYTLYEELCVTSGKQPVKESFYRTIFCNEYNLHFHIPRKDRCDLCEEVKLNKKEDALTAEKKNEYETHVNEKNAAREEKNKDRESATTVYLVFDLQNVLICPHAEISNFYYKSKLNVYHFTAILSSTKQVYSCLWNEMLLGRGGNDIASALVKILDAVFRDNPDLNSLVLWCDSCVPQNRNSFISVAIALFLHDHQNIARFYCALKIIK